MKLLHAALRFRVNYFSDLGRHQMVVWMPGDTPPVDAQVDVGPKLEQEVPNEVFRSDIAPLKMGRFYPSMLLHADEVPAPMFRVMKLNQESFVANFSHPLQGRIFSIDSGKSDVSTQPVGKVEQLLEWSGMDTQMLTPTDFEGADAFSREDETPDTAFYAEPRKVTHVDAVCARRIQALYRTVLPEKARVLDLMASWRSHLPDTVGSVVGLGMNAEELADNPQLIEHIVHDLNAEPRLPFADASFDAVVCTVSFEYLTQPHKIVAEAKRVLKPGGMFVVVVSNRYFPPKVIKLWTELHPMERMAWVGTLIKQGGFKKVETYVERGLKRPKDDRYADKFEESDPLFATWGVA
ncbi:MAG: class I SAM-dependent methyltransferase [Sulfuriferula multivorans]|uniref:Class I SAM-dependent methyltransferase n=1 Tax=Sulfuriferula multivorans TaxID=1559896 RepID=A0A7C9P9I6_9PROT|nr:class I SAM-dependent methyltransferase [Sulfuriferula multivorans]